MTDQYAQITPITANEDELEDSIGSRIRFARKEKGLSQMDLAVRLGVSQPTIANWESGVHDPRQMTLAKVAKALEIPLSWLASGERSAAERDKHPTAAYIRRGLFHVPIVRLEDVTLMLNHEAHDLHELATDYIPMTASSSSHFGFFVNDEAMNLAFPGSTMAIIDYTHRVPVDGDIVLLKQPDGQPLLRRWRCNPPRLEPYSSDPSHETIYVDDLTGIIGTVSVSIRFH